MVCYSKQLGNHSIKTSLWHKENVIVEQFDYKINGQSNQRDDLGTFRYLTLFPSHVTVLMMVAVCNENFTKCLLLRLL